MDLYKVEMFEKIHGKRSFPAYTALAKDDITSVRMRLAQRLGVPITKSALELLTELHVGSEYINENADCDDFSIIRTLQHMCVRMPREVLLVWGQFSEVDRIGCSDLDKYFSDIWFSGADELDVLDDGLEWIMTIEDDGELLWRRI